MPFLASVEVDVAVSTVEAKVGPNSEVDPEPHSGQFAAFDVFGIA